MGGEEKGATEMAEDWGGLAGLPAIFGRTTVHRHRRLVNYCNRLDSTNVGIIFMRSGSSARAWSGTSGYQVGTNVEYQRWYLRY